jgi:hypothetical protein
VLGYSEPYYGLRVSILFLCAVVARLNKCSKLLFAVKLLDNGEYECHKYLYDANQSWRQL